ncbi:MAG: CRISPR-associated protein Csx20 [Bacillota bacterium]
MRNLILLFSHQLTAEQKRDAEENLGVDNIIYLPEELQQIWSNIPAEKEEITELLLPLQEWLEEKATTDDYVLVQGDFGATFIMVQWSLAHDLIPVYATTTREVVEEVTEDDEVNLKKKFKHQLFRKYQQL